MKHLLNNIIGSFLILFLNINFAAAANSLQMADSLSLKEIIQMAVKDHPTIKLAGEAINSADARIGLARSGYYPEVDLTANYSNLGPVTKLTIPDMGTFQLFPTDNYSASINYRQMIYDFGRTNQGIEIEKENRVLGEETLEQARQKLSLLAVNNYFSLVYLQSAIKIKDEQLNTLNEHLEHVKKMFETGSATEYQVLTTRVKISGVESQKTDLGAALAAQQAILVSLTGKEGDLPPVKTDLTSDLPVIPQDSVIAYAFRNRDELRMNREKASIAGMRYDLTKLQNKPVLSIMAAAGAKNGYVPYLNELRPNYVVGLGLRVPLFDGTKNKYNIQQSRSAVSSADFETEYIKRTVVNEISDARQNMIAAEKKIAQFTLQLEQAQKAYSLALTSFNSGVITNLDLLDANTAVSESRLLLLKSKIDYAASVYRFRAALGDRLY
ncbi:MAG TPA: TolC family protein [Bacteroidales bacterium]|nr:TolC family protein [Bacteroidales bacterium]